MNLPYRTKHPEAAEAFAKDKERTAWHDQALWHIRQKRDAAAATVPDWEALRQRASDVKTNVLENLDDYLVQFETEAEKNGAIVHWARDAAEHNDIVHGILSGVSAKRVVKSKSMLTEECGLNAYLEKRGLEIVDTDLGERIVQLREEPPSHIVMPAIHVRKREIGELFHEHLGTPEGESDPDRLTSAARKDLRARFLAADAAITGVNFAIAETGGVVVCTNEGNADLGMHLAPIHIACVGIEKLIPQAADLAVFLRLLARSATGQALTVYTSHVHRPRRNAELHIVLVDNGRSEHLGREKFRSALKCIRCGACMNTCPVYRRSGGHSYGAQPPGPIGAILKPGADLKGFGDLPFASSLCGSCSDVCPVKINIHEQLYEWRQLVKGDRVPSGVKAAAFVMERPKLARIAARVGGALAAFLPGPARLWRRQREIPDAPAKSLKQVLRERTRSGRSSDGA